MSDLSIRPARASDVDAIFSLLLAMFDEAPMPTLDAIMAKAEIGRVVAQEASWVVHAGDQMVATAGIGEGRFWFSADPQLVTFWFYAVPDHRGSQGAWPLLQKAAADLSDDTGMRAWIDVHNPAKTRHAKRLQEGFARFSFEPRGRRLALSPMREPF